MTKEQIKQTILVVEDDVSVLNALVDALTREGFTALRAKDGEEGLRAATENHPDLILLDILMPKMDGITMLKKLREDTWGKSVHIMILTNASDNEKIDEAMQNEAFEYFLKANIKIEDVVAKVKAKLNIVSP